MYALTALVVAAGLTACGASTTDLESAPTPASVAPDWIARYAATSTPGLEARPAWEPSGGASRPFFDALWLGFSEIWTYYLNHGVHGLGGPFQEFSRTPSTVPCGRVPAPPHIKWLTRGPWTRYSFALTIDADSQTFAIYLYVDKDCDGTPTVLRLRASYRDGNYRVLTIERRVGGQ